jgi:uncharacterized protein YggE
MKSAIATLVALVCVTSAQAGITITGNGKVTYVPNMASVYISVSSEALTAAEAWKLNAEKVKKMFAALKELGIDEKDFKTSGLNISPRYHHPKDAPAVLIGYTATYDLVITVRKLDQTGELLDKMADAGANRGMGISFTHDRLEELQEQARLLAVTNARKRAEMYVRAAGGSLGTLVSINEGGAFVPHLHRFEHAPMMAKDSLPIAGGQQDLGTSVTVTYTINNGIQS